jgi:hypothetical protein
MFTIPFKAHVVATLVIVLYAAGAAAQFVDNRQHFEVIDNSEKPIVRYVVTHVFALHGSTEDRDVFLVRDANGDRLRFRITTDYLNQTKLREITDLDTKEFARTTAHMPYKTASRDTTVAAMRRERATGKPAPWPVEFTLNGVTVEGLYESDPPEDWRDSRSMLRAAASSAFLERLERLRPLLGTKPLSSMCAGMFRWFVYEESCASDSIVRPLQPDCAYDAEFGFPCSEQQKQRVRAAEDEGRKLQRY